MLTIKLAFKNLIGAGTRTWLNVSVTSFSFVIIVLMYGLYDGMYKHSFRMLVETEIGGGLYYHPSFDPYDPLTLEESHASPPESIAKLIDEEKAAPVLIVQAAMYRDGRMTPLLMKGIPPEQSVLELPTGTLSEYQGSYIPALVGAGMAKTNSLKIGDSFTVRWRDASGTFDADEVEVAVIMNIENYMIDRGQVWLPLEMLRKMMQTPGEATYVVTSPELGLEADPSGWIPRDHDYLLKDVKDIVESKKAGANIIFILFLGIAALGIFNSQVLSIFRRRKEIGTLLALGMRRGGVIWLFTVEGGLHSVLALFIGAVYGSPLLWYVASKGIPVPYSSDFGIAIGDRIFPYFGAGLVIGTSLLVAIIVTVVSYLPTRRIAKLHPTDALRGRWT